MAEIPIERKGGRNWLPLILLGLLALALRATASRATAAHPPWRHDRRGRDRGDTALGAAGAAGGAGGRRRRAVPARRAAPSTSSSVRRRARHVGRDRGNHQYTATARAARAALGELAGREQRQPIQVYADSMRSSVDRLQQRGENDRTPTTRARRATPR
jgi:hypothetical protein